MPNLALGRLFRRFVGESSPGGTTHGAQNGLLLRLQVSGVHSNALVVDIGAAGALTVAQKPALQLFFRHVVLTNRTNLVLS